MGRDAELKAYPCSTVQLSPFIKQQFPSPITIIAMQESLIFCVLFCATNSLPRPPTPPLITLSKGLNPVRYLETFGWLEAEEEEEGAVPPSPLLLSQALTSFQMFAGLSPTGELDIPTLHTMALPRCGHSDAQADPAPKSPQAEHFIPRRRNKRYILQGTRWTTRELSYKITKYSNDLPRDEVDAIISSAFRQWEDVANISFHPMTPGSKSFPHIELRFEIGEHGDDEGFDGPGGTTAHAYFPIFGGSVHFDDDESWSHSSPQGVNLYQVATHEIGHALGLDHSDNPRSVMAPFYKTYRPDFGLQQDDILGLQALYGKRGEQAENNLLCGVRKVDAATTMMDGHTYIFTGPLVYKLRGDGPVAVAIAAAFPGLPPSLDAAITRANGVSYFFKGEQFWRATNMSIDTTNFPKRISEFFPGVPTPVDAALVFSVDQEIYFFKGAKYWRFDAAKDPPISPGYPRPLRDWEGIPEDGIDAAVPLRDEHGNPFTYFFKGNKYWKFNDNSFSLYISDPPYPRAISKHLFGCRH